MTDLEDRIDDLKFFVALFFDGSTSRCLELDELLWKVRLANRHEPVASRPMADLDDILKELEI